MTAAATTTDSTGDGKAASALDPQLYNDDLAPVKREGRTWRAYNIFTLWAADVHSLGNYTFALGLFALGLGAWQILLALTLGSVLLFALLNLSGYMGYRTGVSFPVMSRISFGIRGAQIPALIRGGVAIVWFGIQTYLASEVAQVLLLALFPSLESLTTGGALGLSTLGWATFTVLWAVQTVIACYGMETIRKYEAIAGPLILVTFVALAVWTFAEAGGSIAWGAEDRLTGVAMWGQILGGAALWVAIYGTFVLNYCDFTRSATSERAITLGNLTGILLNTIGFAVVVVVLTGGRLAIDGTIIDNPTDVVQAIPSALLLAAACLMLLVLTIAVNLMANFVAPALALTNLAPRKLNFKRSVIIAAVLGFIVLPWNLYNTPVVITYFLGGLGALLGPLFGIVMADYWLLRKGKIDVPALYSSDPHGAYFYDKGVNSRAVVTLVVAGTISLAFTFAPQLFSGVDFLGNLSWFVAAGLGAVIYYAIADRDRSYTAVTGEPIAVAASSH